MRGGINFTAYTQSAGPERRKAGGTDEVLQKLKGYRPRVWRADGGGPFMVWVLTPHLAGRTRVYVNL